MTERGTDISKFKRIYRERNEGEFPKILPLIAEKEWDLKYGENPNQQGAIYFLSNARTIVDLTNLQYVRSDGKGKGGLSLTNTMDITRGMDNLKWFSDPACVIMKHNVLAAYNFKKRTSGESQARLFRVSRDADRRSCFGGTAVFNRPLELETVDALFELYRPKEGQRYRMDVVAAPGYEEGVVGKIEKYANDIRISEFSSLNRLPKLIGKDPTEAELDDLVTAWWLNITGARSNGIVFVKDGVSVSVGSGQVERVGAVEQAIV